MTRRLKRRLFAILVTVAAALGGCACGPPAGGTPTTSRGLFDRWIAANTSTVREHPIRLLFGATWVTLTGYLGVYDLRDATIHYDDVEIAAGEVSYPGAIEWVDIHEKGHAVAIKGLGFWIRPEPVTLPVEPCTWGAGGCPSAERAAQCIAEVVLGRGPPFVDDLLGMWDCPAGWVDITRRRMIERGMW